MKSFATSKQIFTNWPKPNFEVQETKNDELFLNDPGIEIFQSKINFDIFNEFPISPFLHDVIKETNSLLNKRNELLIKEEFNDKTDILSILLLALRVDDNDLFFKCYDLLLSTGAKGMEKVLLIYAKIKGFGVGLDDTLQIDAVKPTQTEKNAIVFLESLAKSFDRLQRSAV